MAWLFQLTVCCLGLAILVVCTLRSRRLRAPRLLADPAQVSVIVPARNEAGNLAILLPSLRALRPAPREIIVVDDHSSDETARVAREHGARVVSSLPLPTGMVGKPWACLQGARVAGGDFLLFTDADTWHAPDSLSRALSALLDGQADLLSLIPTHRLRSAWETLQGIFQVLLLIATAAGTRSRHSKRRFAIGQYLLVRRASYEQVGGHEKLGRFIAEDLAMAKLFTKHDLRVQLLYAPGALRVRMYPEGFAAFLAGWRRNFRDGLSAAGPWAALEMFAVIGCLLGAPLALLLAAMQADARLLLLWGAVYAVVCGAVHWAQRGLGRFSFVSAWLYPVFTGVFVWISLCSAYDALRGKDIVWRGRIIQRSLSAATAQRRH